MRRSSLSLASATLLALAPVTPAAPPPGNPPAEAKPSVPESPPVVLNCSTWTCFPYDDDEIQLTGGAWLDYLLPPAPWQWKSVSSQSPCSVAASIEGRKRWIRKGPFDRSTFPVHPDEQTRIDRMYMHGRALVQAGDGANPNEVWNNNDFSVNVGTDTGGGRREWIAVANYAPPTEGAVSGGSVLRVKLRMDLKSKIVLDCRIPTCTAVSAGCASANVTTTVEAIFSDIGTYYGAQAHLVMENLSRRSMTTQLTTNAFCTGSAPGSTGGGFDLLTLGVHWSSGWTVGGTLFDSDWKKRVFKLNFPLCVVATAQAHQWAIQGIGGIEVDSAMNTGTWAEAQAEVELVHFKITLDRAECVECSTWIEPRPTLDSQGNSENGGVQ
jgi:hypothetical protein